MDIAFSTADAAFRDEVRRFLDDNLNERLREAGRLATSVYADRDIMRDHAHRQSVRQRIFPVLYSCEAAEAYLLAARSVVRGELPDTS